MLIFVIFCNFLLIILDFYVAFRLWKIYRFLAKITQVSTRIEQHSNYIFKQVSVVIMGRQFQTYKARELYQELILKFKTIQQNIQLISIVFSFCKRYF
jgi:lipopolysaccharide/colanic/teichoic acid biosynthesis glycosyltransferase